MIHANLGKLVQYWVLWVAETIIHRRTANMNLFSKYLEQQRDHHITCVYPTSDKYAKYFLIIYQGKMVMG